MQQIKCVGFCAGDYFQSVNPEFTRGLAYCVDNDANKWGAECMGIPIVSPETLLKENRDEIFIFIYSLAHYQEISTQLTAMGFFDGTHFTKVNYECFFANSSKIIFNAALMTYFGPSDGDYYEFGVYKGNSFIEAYNLIAEVDHFCNLRYGKSDELNYKGGIPNFRCFCFDSFEGLPKPVKIDVSGAFSEGDYSCDYETFVRNIESAGLDMDRVSIIKGWYSDLNRQTMKDHQMNKARIIHIDCDLYESTKSALAFCTNIINDGTVIIFDDWFHFRGHPYKGEQLAFREWQKANPQFICTEYMREFPFRNSFIVNIL